MLTLKLAYRDHDRTPVIFVIKEMARRYYDLDVEILHIPGTKEYEGSLLDGTCDVIMEHLEYLYQEAARGAKVTMFLAPTAGTGSDLVVPAHVKSVEDLRGGKIAIRSSGRPETVMLRLKLLGLEGAVTTEIVTDAEVGRWRQWSKVASGDAIGTFTSHLYLPPALEAGLKVLPVPDLPIVGIFHHACMTRFAAEHDDVLFAYTKAAIHALCLMKLRREEAMEIVRGEPAKLMKITDDKELQRQYESIERELLLKPYPWAQAILNTHEIGAAEWPGGKSVNPLTLWDMHWVKQLDDAGFIDGLIAQMQT